MRMCVGCREMKPKKELIRIVRAPEDAPSAGAVSIDRTGKAAGRGAYVCVSTECLQKAIKTRALDRALEHPLGEDVKANLTKELERRAFTG